MRDGTIPTTVSRHAVLSPSGTVAERLGNPDYALHVDGAEIGRVSTDRLDDTLREDVDRSFLLRRTRVSFRDVDLVWRIGAFVPGPEEVAHQVRGKRWIAQKTLALRMLNRNLAVVEVPAASRSPKSEGAGSQKREARSEGWGRAGSPKRSPWQAAERGRSHRPERGDLE